MRPAVLCCAVQEYMQSQAQSSKNGPQHLISPGSTAGSSRQAQQRQQQQPQQQRVMLADFPSLDQAAAMGDEVSVPERDYLMEALNKLKLGECILCFQQEPGLRGLAWEDMGPWL